MISKKGQALIEAIAGLTVSILFFVSCLKLWVMAVEEIKTGQNLREKQICELSHSGHCRPEGGFVLVTMLMQLTVLIFAGHVLAALFLTEEYKWKISNWCFENGIEAVTGHSTKPLNELLKMETEANAALPEIINFRTFVEGPLGTKITAGGNSESYYNIRWTIITKFNRIFFNVEESTGQLKCGARKICDDEKCTYSLIADKS